MYNTIVEEIYEIKDKMIIDMMIKKDNERSVGKHRMSVIILDMLFQPNVRTDLNP